MDFVTKKELDTFTELEFEVYNYIMSNGAKIPYMTIRELSEESHVSTTTIVNFCKKLDCQGFSEFKIKYKLSMTKVSSTLPNNNSLENFILRVRTKEFNDTLDEISSILSESTNLISIGNGNSGIMAKYAATYFSFMGKFCLHLENPYFELGPVDLQSSKVIIFSVTGESENLFSFVKSLKENQIPVISVTNNSTNTLAKLTDYNIAYYIQPEYIQGHLSWPKGSTNNILDITSQIPVMYIIETLARKTYNLSMK